MNSSGTLAQDSKNSCISRIDTRQLHVVGKLIGRDSLQQQLSRISVFAFVALERHLAKPEADQAEEYDYQQKYGHVWARTERCPL